jgi:hypothetical protein
MGGVSYLLAGQVRWSSMPATFTCPSCGQLLWIKMHSPARITCPKCLALVVNSTVRVPPAIEPKDVLPVDQDVENDRTGTIRALVVLAIVLLVGAIGAATQVGIGRIFLPLLLCAVVLAAIASAVGMRAPEIHEPQPDEKSEKEGAAPSQHPASSPPESTARVLDYGHRRYKSKQKVSLGAFALGFFAAIGFGAIAFYVMGFTFERDTVSTGERRLIFILLLAVMIGLIFGAMRIGKNPRFNGIGRGVAIGLALAMMAVGPCALCYIGTLAG